MSVIRTLGAGSGLDSAALVAALVKAQREPVAKLLDQRAARVEARISGLGQFRAGLDALNSALGQRVASGSLSPAARVSEPSVLSLRTDPGLTLAPRVIRVLSLASSQLLSTAIVPDPSASLGEGLLTIRFGEVGGTGPAASFTPSGRPDLSVTIGPDRVGLAGIRDAINDAAAQALAPVRAELVPDAGGTRLVLRGETGVVNGFIVETAGDPGLEALRFAPGASSLSRHAVAVDAELLLDGLPVRRSGNEIADLLPGARLTLRAARPDTSVIIAADRSPSELAQVVRDVAAALNELVALGRDLTRGAVGGGTAGALVADSTARQVAQGLAALTTRPLITGDGPTTLAALGVTTSREGAISVNETILQRAVADHPAAIERMVAALAEAPGPFSPGSPLRQLAARLREALQGRPGQPGVLQRESQEIARQRQLLDQRMARAESSLVRQFQLLDARVGETRSIEAALKLQVDLWRRER